MSAAFLVEGRLEQKAIQKICPGSPVRVIGANGRDCSIEAIVKRIESLLRLLNNRHYPIFVIFDRECRDATSEEIELEVLDRLKALGFGEDQFVIGIPDRHIENWIMPHVSEDGIFCAVPPSTQLCDGEFGKGVIRGRLEKASIVYHETTVGAELLCKIVPKFVEQTNPSFSRFRQKGRRQCTWLSL